MPLHACWAQECLEQAASGKFPVRQFKKGQMEDGCRDTVRTGRSLDGSHSGGLVTPLAPPEAYSLEKAMVGFANLWHS